MHSMCLNYSLMPGTIQLHKKWSVIDCKSTKIILAFYASFIKIKRHLIIKQGCFPSNKIMLA